MTDHRSWTLPRQNQFLQSHIGKFKECQVEGTLALKFWPKITRKFYKLWKSQRREIREWEMLKNMVENGGLALPACLGGGQSDAAKQAGLDIVAENDDDEEPDKTEEKTEGDAEGEDGQPDPLSDLSSDDEDVRAANEAALVKTGSIPAPNGAPQPAAPIKKVRKKKKEVIIHVPQPFDNDKTWKEERNKQINRWFYNATAKSRKGGAKVSIDFKGLFSGAIGGRALTEPQMYSKLYYETRIKDEIEAESSERNLSKGQRMALTAQRLQKAYENESEDVKKRVQEAIAKAAREKEEALDILKNMMESGGEKEQTPEEYARIQASLQPIIRCFFDMLGSLTGYAFCVIGGGPKSANLNGSMGYVSYNRGWGESRNDFTFNRWHEDYQKQVVQPFGEYCHELFPEELRLQRAITITESPNLSLDALRRSGRNFGKLQSGGTISLPTGLTSEGSPPVTVPTQPPNPAPSSSTRAPARKAASGSRKTVKKAASSVEEDADDESEEGSDPSDSELERGRRKRKRGGSDAARSRARDEEVSTSESESEKSDDDTVRKKSRGKPKKDRKANKPSTKKGARSKQKGREAKGRAKLIHDETASDESETGGQLETVSKKGGKSSKGTVDVPQRGGKARDARNEEKKDHNVGKGKGHARCASGRKKAKANHHSTRSGNSDKEETEDSENVALGETIDDQQDEVTHAETPGEKGSVPPSPRLPPLPTPPKRKPDDLSLEEGGRQKRSRRQAREPEQWVVATRLFLLGILKTKSCPA
ncbi:hypothetical protein NMY22_g1623 [Coprinellus aureogranulatus]|nr:hypothetical protein NMY22_g1623 [Coprinellus aureogranulatus]